MTMERKVREAALQLSKQFVEDYWNGNATAISAILAPEFTWIGVERGEFKYSRAQMLAIVQALADQSLPVATSFKDFTVACECADSVTIVGRTLARVGAEGGDRYVSPWFRMTFHWCQKDGKLRLAHVHISAPSNRPVLLSLGIVAGTSTLSTDEGPSGYRSGRTSTRDNSLILRDSAGTTHFLNPTSLLYLEADLQYTQVHTTEGTFRMGEVLRRVMQRMPASVVRIHRSYAVNVTRITSIEGNTIMLDSAVALPIPTKRRAAVRKSIVDTLNSLQDDSAAK